MAVQEDLTMPFEKAPPGPAARRNRSAAAAPIAEPEAPSKDGGPYFGHSEQWRSEQSKRALAATCASESVGADR